MRYALTAHLGAAGVVPALRLHSNLSTQRAGVAQHAGVERVRKHCMVYCVVHERRQCMAGFTMRDTLQDVLHGA